MAELTRCLRYAFSIACMTKLTLGFLIIVTLRFLVIMENSGLLHLWCLMHVHTNTKTGLGLRYNRDKVIFQLVKHYSGLHKILFNVL